jgi:hypothetical protein
MLRLQNFCEKVIKDIESLDKSSAAYQNKFVYMAQLAKDLYPTEFKEFTESTKLEGKLNMWKKNSQEMLNLVDSYEINPHTRKITVKMGDEEIIKDIIDVQKYIENVLKIDKPSWKFSLALSIMADVNTFELFQVTNAIILD